MVGETVKARLARKRAELEDVTKQMKPPALPMHDALRARLSAQQAEIQQEIDDLEAKLAGARTS